MSQSWRCSQAGDWTRTAACTSGRIMQSMNSSGNLWWVCDCVFLLMFLIWSSPSALLEPLTGGLYYCRIFSQITWFPYLLKWTVPLIIPSSYRYQSYLMSNHHVAFVWCIDLFPHLCLLLADVPQVQQLSRDPRSPPRQRTEQEVLEEVLLHSTEVRALFLQQGNFQG